MYCGGGSARGEGEEGCGEVIAVELECDLEDVDVELLEDVFRWFLGLTTTSCG